LEEWETERESLKSAGDQEEVVARKKVCVGNKKGTCKRGFVKLLTSKSLEGAAVLRVKE
jgi:hypothetical protein